MTSRELKRKLKKQKITSMHRDRGFTKKEDSFSVRDVRLDNYHRNNTLYRTLYQTVIDETEK